ncbi:MAG: alpha/beta hydrolase, partial [Candidatus Eremiobacterota bacterium]
MAPHLLLLPGLDGTGRMFEPFLRGLPPGLEVSVTAYPDRLQPYADLERYLSWPEGPCVLVAESFSG